MSDGVTHKSKGTCDEEPCVMWTQSAPSVKTINYTVWVCDCMFT